MSINARAGWTLVLGTILLLVIEGRLDVLVILIPLSVVLAFAVGCSGRGETRLTNGIKKG